MASNNRHNTAFVVGSVLGAVAGAAVALWKTPYSGEELRAKLGVSGSHQPSTAQPLGSTTTSTTSGGERSLKDKVLSGVEKTLAPVVGVELGKTAQGSTATPMDSGEIQVNADYGTTLLRHPHAWTDGGETASAGTGSETLGLSRDKVDAEKWAKAYGTSASATAAETQVTRRDTPVVETPTARPEATAGRDNGTTLPPHPHASTEGIRQEPASGTGGERLGVGRSRVDADKWAQAYGTTPESGARYPSKEAESAAQTGLGAKPAYPDNDQTGHEPLDREAPDSNVAEVSGSAGARATESTLTVEDAASVEDLTTPQVDRVPDSMQQAGDGGFHPFPKLGGKEG